jgi:hypothetical protein
VGGKLSIIREVLAVNTLPTIKEFQLDAFILANAQE